MSRHQDSLPYLSKDQTIKQRAFLGYAFANKERRQRTSAASALARFVWLAAAVAAITLLLCFRAETARAAGSLTVSTCGTGVFNHAAVFGINEQIFCPPGTNIPPGMSILTGQNIVSQGTHAKWQANAPSGLTITGVYIGPQQMYSAEINAGDSWGGGFYWAGGGAETFDSTTQYSVSGLNSSYFGFQVVCGMSKCNGNLYPAQLTVESINLYATETQGPSLSAPSGLWQANGWVRGAWTLYFGGDSPSGICNFAASLGGQPLPGSSSLVNNSAWHQCSAPAVSDTVQTGNYGQGAVPLVIRGTDAAGVAAGYSKTIRIDNSQPVVSFSGPADAPTTAGTQYVTATAGGSPSGIDGLMCSLDGARPQWYSGSSTRIAVAGTGDHSLRCAAADNAVDGSGHHGWSAWANWTLSIRQPTASAIGFTKLVDKLVCRLVRERITIPAHWVTVHRHHSTIRIRERAHRQVVKVRRCHARVVHRRIVVWATVVRHGKKRRVKRHKVIRVVELPHAIIQTTKRVPHGKPTTVSGWLGMVDGVPLPDRTVAILTAPDNSLGQFTEAAVATTAANGLWTAQLPAGPSRLVEAVFSGDEVLEPTASAQVHILVRAKVRLIRIKPRSVPWGGTVHIVGQLVGGYLPPGGALVRLRIGFGSHYTTYGVKEHVGGRGRFSTTYAFGLGDPSIHRSYWFQIASLPMGNYPWEPSASRKLSVHVGGLPHRGSGRRTRHRRPR